MTALSPPSLSNSPTQAKAKACLNFAWPIFLKVSHIASFIEYSKAKKYLSFITTFLLLKYPFYYQGLFTVQTFLKFLSCAQYNLN